jgi:hypothetical protein
MESNVIRYTVHTQHCAPAIVSRYFEGYTLIRCQGLWRGKAEDSVQVVIIGDDATLSNVLSLAQTIRTHYNQDEVWVTSETVNLRRVTIDATKEGLA